MAVLGKPRQENYEQSYLISYMITHELSVLEYDLVNGSQIHT